MEPWFDRLSSNDASLDDLVATIGPTMSVVGLAREHCTFYKDPRRFDIVLRMLCGEVVRQCRAHIGRASISVDPSDVGSRIRDSLGLCAELRGRYEDARSRSSQVRIYGACGDDGSGNGTTITTTTARSISRGASRAPSAKVMTARSERGSSSLGSARLGTASRRAPSRAGGSWSVRGGGLGGDVLWPSRNDAPFNRLNR